LLFCCCSNGLGRDRFATPNVESAMKSLEIH
jgi:hypothetical protein